MVFGKRSDGLAIRDIDPGCGTVLSHSSTCCYSRSFYREQEALAFPRASLRQTEGTQDRCAATEDYHLPSSAERRTRREGRAEKEAVAAERRAIKKAARRNLKQQLQEELEQSK